MRSHASGNTPSVGAHAGQDRGVSHGAHCVFRRHNTLRGQNIGHSDWGCPCLNSLFAIVLRSSMASRGQGQRKKEGRLVWIHRGDVSEDAKIVMSTEEKG